MENLIQQTDHLSQNVFLAPGHICLTVVFLPSSQPYSWRVLHSQASTKAPPPPITHILLSVKAQKGSLRHYLLNKSYPK